MKLTVNFDDPDTYHLYYGDALGRPGSMLPPWLEARRSQLEQALSPLRLPALAKRA